MNWVVKTWKYLFNLEEKELIQPEGYSEDVEPIPAPEIWNFIGREIDVFIDKSLITGTLYSVSYEDINKTFTIDVRSPSFKIHLDLNPSIEVYLS